MATLVWLHGGGKTSRAAGSSLRPRPEQLELLSLLGEAEKAREELEGHQFADDPSDLQERSQK